MRHDGASSGRAGAYTEPLHLSAAETQHRRDVQCDHDEQMMELPCKWRGLWGVLTAMHSDPPHRDQCEGWRGHAQFQGPVSEHLLTRSPAAVEKHLRAAVVPTICLWHPASLSKCGNPMRSSVGFPSTTIQHTCGMWSIWVMCDNLSTGDHAQAASCLSQT